VFETNLGKGGETVREADRAILAKEKECVGETRADDALEPLPQTTGIAALEIDRGDEGGKKISVPVVKGEGPLLDAEDHANDVLGKLEVDGIEGAGDRSVKFEKPKILVEEVRILFQGPGFWMRGELRDKGHGGRLELRFQVPARLGKSVLVDRKHEALHESVRITTRVADGDRLRVMDTVAGRLAARGERTEADGEDLRPVQEEETADRTREGGESVVPDHTPRGRERGKDGRKFAFEESGEIRALLEPFGDEPFPVVSELLGLETLRPREAEKRGGRSTFAVVSAGEEGARHKAASRRATPSDGGEEERKTPRSAPGA
jgi:hypothetical protein